VTAQFLNKTLTEQFLSGSQPPSVYVCKYMCTHVCIHVRICVHVCACVTPQVYLIQANHITVLTDSLKIQFLSGTLIQHGLFLQPFYLEFVYYCVADHPGLCKLADTILRTI